MVIKYSRLNSEDNAFTFFYRWAATKFPAKFLRQQILLVGLVIASLLLFIFTTFFTSDVKYDLIQGPQDVNYGVVIDCGSSGSRAHIFIWKKDLGITNIDLLRNDYDQQPLNKHITPGISSFSNNPEKVSDYMEPIMKFISESIPIDRHGDTPISFLATAGLRLLDDSTQKKILNSISKDLRERYDFPNIRSQVITGEREGIYSWLSLNSRKVYQMSDNIKSLGMIEVGGASAQIAFELNPEVENAILKNLDNNNAILAFRNEQVRLDIRPGRTIRLFATTFLGLGVNSGRELEIDLLVRDKLDSTGKWPDLSRSSNLELQLNDPCLTVGSKEVVIRPTAHLKGSRSIGSMSDDHDQQLLVRLYGRGNFSECYQLLERVLKIAKDERLNCSPGEKSCPIELLGSDFIPYNHYSFVGLSEMFFTTDAMMNSAGPFDRTHIISETNRICATDYNKLIDMYPKHKVSYDDRILYECFKASWLLALLHDHGLRMPKDYKKFQTADRLDGKEIDWTIGAMISEVSLGLKDAGNGSGG